MPPTQRIKTKNKPKKKQNKTNKQQTTTTTKNQQNETKQNYSNQIEWDGYLE